MNFFLKFRSLPIHSHSTTMDTKGERGTRLKRRYRAHRGNKSKHDISRRPKSHPPATTTKPCQPNEQNPLEQNNNRQPQQRFCQKDLATIPGPLLDSFTIIHDHQNSFLLPWRRNRFVQTQSEERMIACLIQYGKNERGMMCSQNRKRINFIKIKCSQYGMNLLAALSLRRHHIKEMNPYLPHSTLGLGSDLNIRAAAEVFERTIQEYLEKHNIPFESELKQKQRLQAENQPMVATPDFWFPLPVTLHLSDTLESVNIHWLEVKMFYGADTIVVDSKSAVGCILPKCQTYKQLYGPGAIVFLQGCGENLAQALGRMDVRALDPDPDVKLTPLWTQMRTWCADSQGNILP